MIADCVLAALPALLVTVDPVGAMPLFLALTPNDPERRRTIARRAALASGLVLLLFAVAGQLILRAFGITLAAFRITGGLLLVRAALGMMEGRALHLPAHDGEVPALPDPSLTPLAVPLLAGPGSLGVVVMLMSRHQDWTCVAAVLASIVITSLLTWLILRGAPWIVARVSPELMQALTRLMGLILCAIAVEFVITGLREVVR